MACYEHINLTLIFHKYLLHMCVKTVVYTYMVRNHLKDKCRLVSILCGHNYVCIYAYLCEYCMMGRWPLCTINFWIWNLPHKPFVPAPILSHIINCFLKTTTACNTTQYIASYDHISNKHSVQQTTTNTRGSIRRDCRIKVWFSTFVFKWFSLT